LIGGEERGPSLVDGARLPVEEGALEDRRTARRRAWPHPKAIARAAAQEITVSYEEKRDPELGRLVIAYPQPPGFGWLLVVLGLTFTLLGGIGVPILLTNLGVATKRAAEELRTGFFLTLIMMPGGIALLVWGVLELVRKPEWHICENGLVRLSKGKATSLFFWRDVETVTVVRVLQHGRVVGCHLRLGKKRVYCPNEEVANRGYALWAQANPARIARAS
jgi:hypothetical protein